MQRLLMLSMMLLLLTACGSSADTSDNAIVPVTATAADTATEPASEPVDDDASDTVPEATDDATDDTPAETTDDTGTESGAMYDPATIPLDATYTFEMPWQTEVRLNYPAGWDISEGSRLTLFSPDAYNFQISGSDDPSQTDSAEQALENINQTAPIETRDINGRTVYISSIRSGNGLAATMDLTDGDYGVIQMLSRRGDDLEPMRPLLARLAASMQVVDTSE